MRGFPSALGCCPFLTENGHTGPFSGRAEPLDLRLFGLYGCLDPTDAGGGGFFLADFEGTQVAGVVRVGAAADFEGIVAHLVGADRFTVFALKQTDGALCLGFGNGHLFHDDGNFRVDGDVHEALDFRNLLRRHFPAEGEIETQALGGDIGALLGNLIAQDLPQGGMKQVGSGVQFGGFLILFRQTALKGAFLFADRLMLPEGFGEAVRVHGQAFFRFRASRRDPSGP